MMWRVIVKYKYNDLYFDFSSLENAGTFAKVVLARYQGDDDGRKDIKVVIEPMKILDPKEEEES